MTFSVYLNNPNTRLFKFGFRFTKYTAANFTICSMKDNCSSQEKITSPMSTLSACRKEESPTSRGWCRSSKTAQPWGLPAPTVPIPIVPGLTLFSRFKSRSPKIRYSASYLSLIWLAANEALTWSTVTSRLDSMELKSTNRFWLWRSA